MSNAGQAALTIVGTVVGGYFGYPQLGYLAGSLAGTALFPTQLPDMQGPRLGEGQSTSAVVGAPIPWVFGTQRVGGIVIWASPIREIAHTEEVGGKGGPEQSQTTYEYRRSYAILLCEGPIAGIRRIWANGKLVFDLSTPSDFDLGDIEGNEFSSAVQRFIRGQIASQQLAARMTVYLGTEDQMPDPTMESFLGAGNVPAYRGYAYVVFDDVELKPEDGYRIPNWSFEVYQQGDESNGAVVYYSNELLFPWLDDPADFNPANPLNDHNYFAGPHGILSDQPPMMNLTFSTEAEALGYFVERWNAHRNANLSLTASHRIAVGMTHGTIAARQLSMYPYDTFPPGEYLTARIYYNEAGASTYLLDINALVSNSCDQIPWLKENAHWKYAFGHSANDERSGAVLQWVDDPQAYGQGAGSGPYETSRFGNSSCSGQGYGVVRIPDVQVRVIRVPRAPDPPATDRDGRSLFLENFPGWVLRDGILYPINSEWELHSTTYRVLQKYDEIDLTSSGALINLLVKYPLNPARPVGHPEYNDQAFWEEAYAVAVAKGQMPAGLTYGVDYPKTQSYGYRLTINLSAVSPQPVTLASIVSRIVERVGLEAYDVSDLESVFVHGYTIANANITARGAIEPGVSIGYIEVDT